MGSLYNFSLGNPATASLVVLVVLVVLLLLLLRTTGRELTAKPKRRSLPPGPKGLPLLGNVFDIDKRTPWLTYTDWKKLYGDIASCRVFGQQYIILNSEKATKALIEHRSSTYSDRPAIATVALFGMDFNTAHLPYGNTWRAHRRMYHLALNTGATERYHPVMLEKGRVLLRKLLDAPEDFSVHLRTFSMSIIMAIVYGYEVAPRNDGFIAPIDKLMSMVVLATPERAALLNVLPPLRYIPAWFPGAGLQRLALQCKQQSAKIRHTPFQFVKDCLSKNVVNESMVSNLLRQGTSGHQDQPSYEQDIKDCAMSAFLAGADSTQSTLLTFILAMVLHPDAQDCAHAELDAVIGCDRLPTFSDRGSLPFVEAVFRETSRWGALVPLGIPHMAAKDDEFDGYQIPKGSIVIKNLWAMAKDKDVFQDSAAFRPERFLDTEGYLLPEDPSGLFFGYGRRACPGRHVANASAWLAVAFMLSTFKFGKAIGPAGYEINVSPKFTGGIALRPLPFACSIKPRSEKPKELLD
ncbi:hypothetical protein HYDPIDRAFT_113935 [Hydnomerulius pinastri MD-312]|uniref:Cytochrome P450 n=1 Tax=Hydnomerulius pinastri MD-312 TaxID=994086 RepID=A0A0C9WD87_9AGAM|nr:hypothetical protein HYDPIDRAFT_113935 [Hydnomerulius pinastri MD-312]